jgi:hypothetical protein
LGNIADIGIIYCARCSWKHGHGWFMCYMDAGKSLHFEIILAAENDDVFAIYRIQTD